jgi:hypothetical protein
MQHDDAKERQEASLLGRIFSLEVALFLMGCLSLIYGLTKGIAVNIFWGLIIIPGVFLLHKVKKKDWKAHWATLEEEQKKMQERKNGGEGGQGGN